jgi:hypothetical protein
MCLFLLCRADYVLQLTGLDIYQQDKVSQITANTSLVLNGYPNASLVTLDVPRTTASYVALKFATALPTGLTLTSWMVPTDIATLRAVYPTAATQLIASSSWNGSPATRFVDRYVVHPSSSLPSRWLSCPPVAGASSQIMCLLPPNPSGSLWRLFVGWGLTLPDGSIALHAFSISIPLLSPTGRPLTLSFAMPLFNYEYANHFALNFLKTQRPVPPKWSSSQESNQLDIGMCAVIFWCFFCLSVHFAILFCFEILRQIARFVYVATQNAATH